MPLGKIANKWLGRVAGLLDESPVTLPSSSYAGMSTVHRPNCDGFLKGSTADLMKMTSALLGGPCSTTHTHKHMCTYTSVDMYSYMHISLTAAIVLSRVLKSSIG